MITKRVAILLAALLSIPATALAERDYSGKRGDGRPPPLSLEAGPLTVFISGRAQVQGAFLVGSDARLGSGDAASEHPGVLLRRARMGLAGNIDRLRVGVEINLLQSDQPVHEGYVGYDSRWAQAFVGLVKVPFSRSALISSEALQLAERAISTQMISPFQQLGITLGGKVWEDRIRLLAGVYNGMNRAETVAGGWARGNPRDGNLFGGFATAARVDIEPLGTLGAGVSDLQQTRDVRFGIGGGVLYNRGLSVQSLGYGADAALKAYGFSLMAEFMRLTTRPADSPTQGTSTTAEVTSQTISAQVGYAAIANLLEIAARFEMLDEDTELEDEGDSMAIAGTLSSWLLDGHVKMQLFYQHRLESKGTELDNNVLMLNVEGRF